MRNEKVLHFLKIIKNILLENSYLMVSFSLVSLLTYLRIDDAFDIFGREYEKPSKILNRTEHFI